VRRTQPYRNNRIIRVIQELFFSGGSSSFAAGHDNLFTTHGPEHEVPIPMVSLVATGVSWMIICDSKFDLGLLFSSYMPLFMSGRQVNDSMLNSLRMHSRMFTWGM